MVSFLGYAWLALTFVGIVVMRMDKGSARAGTRRTSEKTLFFIACVGGSVGIWIGMYLFRHKTKHKQFTIGIPIIIAVQVYCLYRLFS